MRLRICHEKSRKGETVEYIHVGQRKQTQSYGKLLVMRFKIGLETPNAIKMGKLGSDGLGRNNHPVKSHSFRTNFTS